MKTLNTEIVYQSRGARKFDDVARIHTILRPVTTVDWFYRLEQHIKNRLR